MSRSPAESTPKGGYEDYLEAFRTVFRLHEEGKSFSGRERNCVFLNPGAREQRFADISASSGLDFPDDGRGLALADWDRDGDVDLWIANRTGPQIRYLRNENQSTGASVTFRLQGRAVNRDAVGARLTVQSRRPEDGSTIVQIRGLRAGEGFLSQSSAWLHLGLGDYLEIDSVRVSWPGGAEETWSGLAAGGRYRLIEGCGDAGESGPECAADAVSEIAREEKEPSLEASRSGANAVGASAGWLPSDSVRGEHEPELKVGSSTPPVAPLASRVPLPSLSFRDFAGQRHTLSRVRAGQPLLINLWASWCVPCLSELASLRDHRADLEAAGLQVLTLSVDGQDPETDTTPEDAQRFLVAQNIPFRAGLADAELLTKLQILLDRLFSRRLLLAVPTSLLVDSEGNLAAVYRGAVHPDRLLADLRGLDLDAPERRAWAVPFPGRWLAPPAELSLSAFAQRFYDRGYPQEALAYLEESLRRQPADLQRVLALGNLLTDQSQWLAAEQQYRRALELDPDSALAWRRLGDLLQLRAAGPQAAQAYYRSLDIDPEQAEVRYNLANTLQAQGRLQEAVVQHRQALALEPAMAEAHNNLGTLLLTMGRPGEAQPHLQRATELDPALAQPWENLGIMALQAGRGEEAIALFERAVQLQPASPGAHNNLGVALMRSGKLQEARASFARALELASEFTDARDNLRAVDAELRRPSSPPP